MVAVTIDGARNHQHAELVRARRDLQDGLAHVRGEGGQVSALFVRLRVHRAVVAAEKKIIEDTFARVIDEEFVGVKIFCAAHEPIVEIFGGNFFFQSVELLLLFARKFIRFLFVEERGVPKNFCAVRVIIFGLGTGMASRTRRAHNRPQRVNRQVRKFFMESFESLRAFQNFFGRQFVHARGNQAAVNERVGRQNGIIGLRGIFFEPLPNFFWVAAEFF